MPGAMLHVLPVLTHNNLMQKVPSCTFFKHGDAEAQRGRVISFRSRGHQVSDLGLRPGHPEFVTPSPHKINLRHFNEEHEVHRGIGGAWLLLTACPVDTTGPRSKARILNSNRQEWC